MAASLNFCQVTSVIWAIVSDGKQAYAFKYRKEETLFRDKVVVLKGNRWKPASSQFCAGRGIEEPTKVTNEVVKNFIPTIAAKLEKALDEHAFDYIVIVAPRNTLDALRGSLKECVRNRLLSNLPEGYIYDKKGAVFALREEASAHFDVYTKTICRSLPPCCTRNERVRYSARTGRYGSTKDAAEDIYERVH
jgi:protein required for attachment to host cells